MPTEDIVMRTLSTEEQLAFDSLIFGLDPYNVSIGNDLWSLYGTYPQSILDKDIAFDIFEANPAISKILFNPVEGPEGSEVEAYVNKQ